MKQKPMKKVRDTVSHEAGVVLKGAKFFCTECKKWKPASRFGLRQMPNGVIRNQAQCIKCRSESAPREATG